MDARANRLAHHLPPRAWAPATTSASTRYNSRGVGRGDAGPSSSSVRCGSTSTTATSRTSSRYLFDNADLMALVYRAGVRAPGRHRAQAPATPAPHARDRATATDGDGARRLRVAPSVTDGLRAALRRRPLHPLHRRHDRHAQGRRVAPRGRLLRARRRHRPAPPTSASTGPRPWSRRARPAGPLTFLPIAPAHARRHPVGVMQLPGQHGRARRQVRPAPGLGSWSSARRSTRMMITGDAMGRPLIEALERPGRRLRPRRPWSP